MQIETIFIVVILILSVVIHEVAHGYAANMLGDPTARLAGRLTLNPLKHIDLMGSIIIPGLLVFTHSPILFGWAKPVPYNPYNLRGAKWVVKWGEAFVAGAGPFTNIVIALAVGLSVRSAGILGVASSAFIEIGSAVVFINVLLAVINLIPLPPLDGSKVFAPILPAAFARSYTRFRTFLEYNVLFAFALVLLFISLFGGVFIRCIYFISALIIGG